MSIKQCVPKKTGSTASRMVESEAVVVSPNEGLVRILNEVGSRVWELIDGNTTVDSIVSQIREEFNAEQNAVETDVIGFLNDLQNKGMVTING